MPLSRNARVIRFLVEQAPGVGRTRLIKFAYLADLESRHYLGRSITDFHYIRYTHGPWDKGFYGVVAELTAEGLLREERIEFPNGTVGYRYEATGSRMDYGFSPEDAVILAHIAETYAVYGARELCDEVVYQTEPMKAEVEMNGELPMDAENKAEQDELGFDLRRMLAGEKSVREGRFQPLEQVIRELQARPHT